MANDEFQRLEDRAVEIALAKGAETTPVLASLPDFQEAIRARVRRIMVEQFAAEAGNDEGVSRRAKPVPDVFVEAFR